MLDRKINESRRKVTRSYSERPRLNTGGGTTALRA
jgi:hypothetical protein